MPAPGVSSPSRVRASRPTPASRTRGPDGIWTHDPSAERLSTLSAYLGDEQLRRRAWQSRLASPVWSARPTPGHRALVALERAGRLGEVVTESTDGLHLAAGHGPERVIELHGTVHVTECLRARSTSPPSRSSSGCGPARRTPRAGGGRNGSVGGGILKVATVSFGQSLDPEVLDRAVRAAVRAEVLLAVGTTLEVHPAAGLVPPARREGAAVVIVSASPTALDGLAAAVVRGSISEVLARLVPVSPRAR